MKSFILTDGQRKLAEEQHNLIYGFLKKFKLSYEDWYDIAAISFCKAASKYDPGRNAAFSTFAYRVMLNDVRMEMRKERVRRKSGITIISLQSELCDNFTLEEIVGCMPKYFIQEAEAPVEIERFIKTLPPKERFIIRSLDEGYKQTEIAQMLNISQSYVSRIIKELRATFKEDFLVEGAVNEL